MKVLRTVLQSLAFIVWLILVGLLLVPGVLPATVQPHFVWLGVAGNFGSPCQAGLPISVVDGLDSRDEDVGGGSTAVLAICNGAGTGYDALLREDHEDSADAHREHASLEESAEIDGDIITHAAVADAHREHASLEESAEIDGDIITHAAVADAHREHASLEESSEIDGDIVTHAAIADAHREHASLEESAEIDGDIVAHVSAENHEAQLTDEQVQDYVAELITGNTETRITVTYSDAGDDWNFVVEDMYDAHGNGSNCSANEAPRGVDANGAAESCNAVTMRAGEAIANNRLLRGNSTTGAQGSGITCTDGEVCTGFVAVTSSRLYATSPTGSGVGDVCFDTGDDELTNCAPSSRRYKRDIRPLGVGLDAVRSLRGVSFEYRSPDDPEGRHAGLIAEDVVGAIPDSGVYKDGQVDNYSDRAVLAALVEANKELYSALLLQKEFINNLLQRVEWLERGKRGKRPPSEPPSAYELLLKTIEAEKK